jgi:hypothetical protein
MRRTSMGIGALVSLCAVVSVSLAVAAGPFVEPEVTTLYTLVGEQPSDGFGWIAENLGDINGDGRNDFVTSAPFYRGTAPISGKVYVYSGADGALLNSITGEPFSQFGYGLSRAGDVNGDKIGDYVVGSPGFSRSDPPFQGRVQVFSGADHTLILDLPGPPGIALGRAATGAGDVNRDGFDDIIVGAEQASFAFPQAGRVYVFSGKDGSIIWARDGNGPQHLLGQGVGRVGDINNDGVPDLVAGAPGAGSRAAGEAYVYSGVDGSVLHTLEPVLHPQAQPSGTYGVFFASGAGDINRDGVPDIYIGDYNATVKKDRTGAGRVYIYSGATGRVLRTYNGEEAGDGFGPGRAIGDIDGDGRADLIVAAYLSSAGAPTAGKAYVISGRNRKVLRTITSTIESHNLGVDALSLGDVNQDGLSDFILTANNFASPGTIYVVAGSAIADD